MKLLTIQTTSALLLAASTFSSALAQNPAQQPKPATAPPVSPYLNLLNRRTNPAINYYGIVRPQIQFNQAINQQQTQINQLQQGTVDQLRRQIDQLPDRLRQDLAASQPAATPIPTFGNYSHYYTFPRFRR